MWGHKTKPWALLAFRVCPHKVLPLLSPEAFLLLLLSPIVLPTLSECTFRSCLDIWAETHARTTSSVSIVTPRFPQCNRLVHESSRTRGIPDALQYGLLHTRCTEAKVTLWKVPLSRQLVRKTAESQTRASSIELERMSWYTRSAPAVL